MCTYQLVTDTWYNSLTHFVAKATQQHIFLKESFIKKIKCCFGWDLKPWYMYLLSRWLSYPQHSSGFCLESFFMYMYLCARATRKTYDHVDGHWCCIRVASSPGSPSSAILISRMTFDPLEEKRRESLVYLGTWLTLNDVKVDIVVR